MKQVVYKEGGINGACLKWIAIVTMVIDHFASGFIIDYHEISVHNLLGLYANMRLLGRIAFPIFAFLMVQGYQHTSDLKRYLRNLFILGLISEIPFDLAFYDQVFYWGHQNIFFTLATGILVLSLYEKWHKKNRGTIGIILFIAGAFLAELFFFDYGFYGITFIFGLGMLREQKILQTLFGVFMGFMQKTASLAFIFIWFYNGERGRQNKWLFYVFYPAHLVIIYFLRLVLL